MFYLVGESGAQAVHHRPRSEVLAGDELQARPLAGLQNTRIKHVNLQESVDTNLVRSECPSTQRKNTPQDQAQVCVTQQLYWQYLLS